MKYVFLLVVAVSVVALDQATKALVIEKIPLHQNITVIPDFFSLTHLYNPGGAFGFLSQITSLWRHWLFVAATIFATALIVYFYHQTPRRKLFLRFALGLIFGGAIGNLVDRVRYGEVVDFLLFYIGQYVWPAFNVADSAVTIGVGIFLFHIVFKKMPY